MRAFCTSLLLLAAALLPLGVADHHEKDPQEDPVDLPVDSPIDSILIEFVTVDGVCIDRTKTPPEVSMMADPSCAGGVITTVHVIIELVTCQTTRELGNCLEAYCDSKAPDWIIPACTEPMCDARGCGPLSRPNPSLQDVKEIMSMLP